LHLGYRWFLGYDFDVATPDHSVLSKARARLGSGVFEEFFRQSIELCRQAGLLDEGPVYVDSTLIRAGASVDSLKRREDLVQPPLSVQSICVVLTRRTTPLRRRRTRSIQRPASSPLAQAGAYLPIRNS
jgi:hypothetical protein